MAGYLSMQQQLAEDIANTEDDVRWRLSVGGQGWLYRSVFLVQIDTNCFRNYRTCCLLGTLLLINVL